MRTGTSNSLVSQHDAVALGVRLALDIDLAYNKF